MNLKKLFALSIILFAATAIGISACNSLENEKQATETTADSTTTATSTESPCNPFPFPPPKASAFKVIPKNLFVKGNDTVDLHYVVESKLLPALDKAGYEYSFYCVKDKGIAIVTRLEKINRDGTPSDDRYLTDGNSSAPFGIKDYIKSLFFARPGYYRVIVFIICPYPIAQSSQGINKKQADSLFTAGTVTPYDSILSNEFSSKYQCTAFIYEFMKPNAEDPAEELDPSTITGITHLQKGGIWPNLLSTNK